MIRLPGERVSPPALTKLQIAERHILSALQMTAVRASPYSTHLVVMAADEIIETVADKNGVLLDHSSKIFIKPEYQKEWFRLKRKASNYFKHADRDHDQLYDGPDYATLQNLNDLILVFSIYGLRKLGHQTPLFYNEVLMTIFGYYPQYYRWEDLISEHPEIEAGFRNLAGTITRRQFESLLLMLLRKHSAIDLEY